MDKISYKVMEALEDIGAANSHLINYRASLVKDDATGGVVAVSMMDHAVKNREEARAKLMDAARNLVAAAALVEDLDPKEISFGYFMDCVERRKF